MKSLLLFVLISFIYSGNIFSQSADTLRPISSLDELRFMEGEWKGEGWLIGTDQKRKYFSQIETIESKVKGLVFIVQGLGYAIEESVATDKIVHDAFGLISFNEERGTVTMVSFTEANGRMESNMMKEEEGLIQWSFRNPDSSLLIRFTEDFREDGVWYEKGEIQINNSYWYQFFETKLIKQ